MKKIFEKISKKGLPPGSLVYTGEETKEPTYFEIIEYNEKEFNILTPKTVEELKAEEGKVRWINILGVHETHVMEKIGEIFDIHPLVLEDIMNVNHNPKYEETEKYNFFVLKMLNYNKKKFSIDTEQISIIQGKNYVISFQEKKGDVFDSIRKRIDTRPKFRKQGSDYLAYTLIDSVVDNYFTILGTYSEKLEEIEEKIMVEPHQRDLNELNSQKRELLKLRKSIWPIREIISGIQRTENKHIKKTTLPYYRDVYDHTIQIIDTTETFRDISSGLVDLYMSSISNKMNEVMKVLTIFATIFIPLTFIAGIYGMNFEYMPELAWKYGYLIIWIIFIIIGGGMLLYFKKKKWI